MSYGDKATRVGGADVLGGGGRVGRLLQRSPQFDSDMYRKQGAGRSVERDCQSVSAAAEHLHCESSGSMPAVQGWRHLTTGKVGSSEARGGREDGEAAEGGSSGPVDGKPQRGRMGEGGEI